MEVASAGRQIGEVFCPICEAMLGFLAARDGTIVLLAQRRAHHPRRMTPSTIGMVFQSRATRTTWKVHQGDTARCRRGHVLRSDPQTLGKVAGRGVPGDTSSRLFLPRA